MNDKHYPKDILIGDAKVVVGDKQRPRESEPPIKSALLTANHADDKPAPNKKSKTWLLDDVLSRASLPKLGSRVIDEVSYSARMEIMKIAIR